MMSVMEERDRNESRDWLREYWSIFIAAISFWLISLSWNAFSEALRPYVYIEDLALVPRLGLGAALSWVVFLHVEVVGMIIMARMKEKWEAKARAEAEAKAQEVVRNLERQLEKEREARAEREAKAQEIIRDLERQLEEARGGGANGGEGASDV